MELQVGSSCVGSSFLRNLAVERGSWSQKQTLGEQAFGTPSFAFSLSQSTDRIGRPILYQSVGAGLACGKLQLASGLAASVIRPSMSIGAQEATFSSAQDVEPAQEKVGKKSPRVYEFTGVSNHTLRFRQEILAGKL